MSKVELRSVFEIITLKGELWYGYYECFVKTNSYTPISESDCHVHITSLNLPIAKRIGATFINMDWL